jgi:hypothetical protein
MGNQRGSPLDARGQPSPLLRHFFFWAFIPQSSGGNALSLPFRLPF